MKEKVILITGASSGIGKSTAMKLLEEGHKVYGAARRVEQMKDIIYAGGSIIQLDVTDKDLIQSAVEKIISEQGRIDVLINNAGYGLYGAVEDIPVTEARRQFEVNIFGPALLTKAVLPHMRSQLSGTIINMSSMGGRIYSPLGAWYHASKHALEGWSDCLRMELKPFNIDVVIVEPGVIATEFGDLANEPLLQHSGNGPYKKLANAMALAMNNQYNKGGNASSPSVISSVISQAIKAKRPKTRYIAGKWAKTLILFRTIFGDRLFDWTFLSQIKAA